MAGACATGTSHSDTMSYDYVLNYGPTATGEAGFRRCIDCAGIVHPYAYDGKVCVCQTGKPHRLDESFEFKLAEASDGKAQGGWRACTLCGVVFQSGEDYSGGLCSLASVHKTHVGTSKVYYIPYGPNADGMIGPLEYAQRLVSVGPGERLRVNCIFNAANKKLTALSFMSLRAECR